MPMKLVAALFFALASASALLQGFHVDDESCSGLVADNATQQVTKCASFFALLSNVSEMLHAASGQLPSGYPPLRLSVDTGTA